MGLSYQQAVELLTKVQPLPRVEVLEHLSAARAYYIHSAVMLVVLNHYFVLRLQEFNVHFRKNEVDYVFLI